MKPKVTKMPNGNWAVIKKERKDDEFTAIVSPYFKTREEARSFLKRQTTLYMYGISMSKEIKWFPFFAPMNTFKEVMEYLNGAF